MIHGPARQWPQNGYCLTDNDKSMLNRIGPCPFKGISFYTHQDWQWLSDHGFYDVGMRLWSEHGILPHPVTFVNDKSPQIEACFSAGLVPWLQVINEPNLELPNMTPLELSSWLITVQSLLRQHFPGIILVSPPISQDSPNSWQYRLSLGEAFDLFDELGVDFYWGDMQEDASWSPSWWKGQFPSKLIRVLECGGYPGTDRRWRYDTYPSILARYKNTSYIKSFHVFLMSSEDKHWQETGHTYDENIVSILQELNS